MDTHAWAGSIMARPPGLKRFQHMLSNARPRYPDWPGTTAIELLKEANAVAGEKLKEKLMGDVVRLR